MATIDPIPLTEVSDAALLDRIRTGRGWIPNVFRTMLHSPTATAGWVELANSVRSSSLDLRTRELAILLVAHLKQSEYEWGHHEGVARANGVSDSELAALRAWPNSSSWQPRDRAVLSIVAAVASNRSIPEWSLTEIAEEGPRVAVDVAVTAAYYVAVAHFTAALDIPPDGHEP